MGLHLPPNLLRVSSCSASTWSNLYQPCPQPFSWRWGGTTQHPSGAILSYSQTAVDGPKTHQQLLISDRVGMVTKTRMKMRMKIIQWIQRRLAKWEVRGPFTNGQSTIFRCCGISAMVWSTSCSLTTIESFRWWSGMGQYQEGSASKLRHQGLGGEGVWRSLTEIFLHVWYLILEAVWSFFWLLWALLMLHRLDPPRILILDC